MNKKEFDKLLSEFNSVKQSIKSLEKRKDQIQDQVKPYGTLKGFLYYQVVVARKTQSMDYEKLLKRYPKIFEGLKRWGILKETEALYHHVSPQNKEIKFKGNKVYGPEKLDEKIKKFKK